MSGVTLQSEMEKAMLAMIDEVVALSEERDEPISIELAAAIVVQIVSGMTAGMKSVAP